jgi:hypothetical protein
MIHAATFTRSFSLKKHTSKVEIHSNRIAPAFLEERPDDVSTNCDVRGENFRFPSFRLTNLIHCAGSVLLLFSAGITGASQLNE